MLHRRDAMLRLGSAACGVLTLPQLMAMEKSKAESGKRSRVVKKLSRMGKSLAV